MTNPRLRIIKGQGKLPKGKLRPRVNTVRVLQSDGTQKSSWIGGGSGDFL